MEYLKTLYYTLLRVLMLLLFLTSYPIVCFALTNNIKQEVLERASDLIDDNDSNAAVMKHKIDSVESQKALSDSVFVSFIVDDVGEYFRQQGRQSAAVELFSTLADQLEQEKCLSSTLLRLYIPLGAALEEVGMWNNAMEYYHKALAIAEDNGMESNTAKIYNNIGAAYFRSDVAMAESYFRKARDINMKLGDKKELCLNYNNLAGTAMQQDRYDEALDYMLDALQLIDKNQDAYFYHFMQCNIASLYMLKGEDYLAISYLRNAVEFHLREGNLHDVIQCYNMLAEAYEKQGNMTEAMYYIKQSEMELASVTNRDFEANMSVILSRFYSRRKNYEKAYDLLLRATELRDSLTKVNDVKKIGNLEQIYNNEQKLRENALLISEMQLHKLEDDRRVTVIVIIIILLALVVVFLIVRTRLRDKLHRTKEELSMQQIALSEKEKELQLIKEKELNKTIDQKNRELSSYALSYTKDNEFFVHICDELKQVLLEINPRDKLHKERLRKIITELKRYESSDNWQEFKLYFEQVHPSFYDSLDDICPGITQRQKRLCALLYIGLSTKEIASITFREVRSVESARNRLRRKMGIPSDETIHEFLSKRQQSE